VFTLTKSRNNMLCIEIENPTNKVRDFIRNAVMENRIEHPAYIASRNSTPFLQADYPDYLLVEFWGRNPQPFMDYLNKTFK